MAAFSNRAFGSARFATPHEMARAGLFKKSSDSVFIGFHCGRALYFDGMGGIITVAGARSGKLIDQIGFNVLPGGCDQSMAILDPKGEIAAISRGQVANERYCIYFNPTGMHGLPMHRMNPIGSFGLTAGRWSPM